MPSSSDSALDRLRQPEYTGENRCIPCTAVNVVIAAALAALAGRYRRTLGYFVFGVSLTAIYLRGYLVPGTPTLTKRYFPDWVLAKFDKAPPHLAERESRSIGAPGRASTTNLADDSTSETTDESGEATDETTPTAVDGQGQTAEQSVTDPEVLLSEAGAVEPCEEEDDLCLTDEFAEEWREAVERLRDDSEGRAEAVAALYGVESVNIHDEVWGPGAYDADTSDQLNSWVSEGALLADAAAQEALYGREVWADVPTEQRRGILRALRSFLTECPVCGGEVGMTEDTVESCCRSWDVIAVQCADCEEHYLELDPASIGVSSESQMSDTGDRGPQSISGGFTRG